MSWLIYIGLSALAGWMIGFIMGRMSQPSATPTQAEIKRAAETTSRKMSSYVCTDRERWKVQGEEGAEWIEVTPNFITEEQANTKAVRVDRDTNRIFLRDLTDEQRDRLRLMGCITSKAAEKSRRRDDNRPHTQPEGDWEEKA
jgi:hypothetical protein